MNSLNGIVNIFQAMAIGLRKEGTFSVPGWTPELPNELWTMIFDCLGKSDLKAIRCVCQHFSLLAGPFLFDKVYVSPHRINLDVFTKIAQHPTLSLYPRVLVYQVLVFDPTCSFPEYFIRLCDQLSLFLRNDSNKSQLFDKEHQALLRVAEKCGSTGKTPEPFPEPDGFRIVQQSFKYYMDEAAEQDHCNQSGEFLASVCFGLAKLINVRSVEMGTWDYLVSRRIDKSKKPPELPFSPSPLARSWNLFQLRPRVPPGQDREFNNAISIFSLTGRCMQQLDFDYPVYVSRKVFDPESKFSRTFRRHGDNAMNHLERLKISVDSPYSPYGPFGPFGIGVHGASDFDDEDAEDAEDAEKKNASVCLLTNILSRMPKLRYLGLQVIDLLLPPHTEFLRFNEIFSDHMFPALEVLDLKVITGSEVQISAFFRAQPKLNSLLLQYVNLE